MKSDNETEKILSCKNVLKQSKIFAILHITKK